MTETSLEVLYEDEFFIAINKPHNLLVHKSKLCNDKITAVKLVRELTSTQANPVHRLDKATAGVLLFAKDKASTKYASDQFMNHEVQKTYLAVLRGWPPEEEGVIDSPIKNQDGEIQEAVTAYKVLNKIDYPNPVGKFKSSWYSLIRAFPKTGRMHQIRRHVRRVCGPVIGDTQLGDGKHNNVFREKFNSQDLLLFAESLTFTNLENQLITVTAPLPHSFLNIFHHFEWDKTEFL